MKLEQRYIEDMNHTQQPPWLVNNILFCYGEETHTENDSERKQHFLQHKVKHSNNKEVYTYGSKSMGRKVGFAAVFVGIFRKGDSGMNEIRTHDHRSRRRRHYQLYY